MCSTRMIPLPDSVGSCGSYSAPRMNGTGGVAVPAGAGRPAHSCQLRTRVMPPSSSWSTTSRRVLRGRCHGGAPSVRNAARDAVERDADAAGARAILRRMARSSRDRIIHTSSTAPMPAMMLPYRRSCSNGRPLGPTLLMEYPTYSPSRPQIEITSSGRKMRNHSTCCTVPTMPLSENDCRIELRDTSMTSMVMVNSPVVCPGRGWSSGRVHARAGRRRPETRPPW